MQTPSSRQGEENALLNHLHTRYGVETSIPLETFIEAALYAPDLGYYARDGERVGYREGRDFYTAESLGRVFRKLVIAACLDLLPEHPDGFQFTELGAEPGAGLLAQQVHPFASSKVWGCRESFELKGPEIVFSNELFDAQPFRRFKFVDGQWQEQGLRLTSSGYGALSALKTSSSDAEHLPAKAAEGYLLDDPSGARRLIEQIVAADWHGLFIAFDYGLDRKTLHQARPQGTGRTYRDHRMGNNLLEAPGRTDITHHICWDDLQEALQNSGFLEIKLQSQESFFVHHAETAMAEIIESAAQKGLSRDLQTLKELLHPEHMGRKFQVLTAFRAKNTCQGSDKGR